MDPNAVDPELNELERRSVEFFDGELDAGERANFEARVAVEPELARGLDNWGFVGDALRASLEAEAEALPQARFEQAWDQFDATLAREGRLQEAAGQAPSLWSRIAAFLAPIRVPLAVGAAAAVIGVVAYSSGDGSPAVPEPTVATAQPASPTPEAATPEPGDAAGQPETAPAEPGGSGTQLAVAPEPATVEPFPAPASNEAEIERIEFGGRSGTISKVEGTRGTTTVIWVQEDEEPVESERSL